MFLTQNHSSIKIKQLYCSRLLIPCFCLQISSCHWFQSVVISLICTHKWVKKKYSQLSVKNVIEQNGFLMFHGNSRVTAATEGWRVWGAAVRKPGVPCSVWTLNSSPDPAFSRAFTLYPVINYLQKWPQALPPPCLCNATAILPSESRVSPSHESELLV